MTSGCYKPWVELSVILKKERSIYGEIIGDIDVKINSFIKRKQQMNIEKSKKAAKAK